MRQFVLVLVFATVGTADVGVVDTVGGTTIDWQANGPALRTLVGSEPFGLHVVWMYSSDTGQTSPDRNMRYNFYDYASRAWNWIDPDYMQSGVNVFTARSGFGTLAADPVTGAAVISGHQGGNICVVGRDQAAGAGILDYCVGPAGGWPVIGVTQNRTVHVAFTDGELKYSRIVSWCNWDSAITVGPPGVVFADQNLAAAREGDKVCITWVATDTYPYHAFYRVSESAGDTWGLTTDLGFPPAFGPDTGFSYYFTSPFPFYDAEGRLHMVVDGMPIIRDTVFACPNEIWHWCAENNPPWSRIRRANGGPSGRFNPGYNALFACRPSIGEDTRGGLFVSWEEFDTSNVEPLTGLMRAEVLTVASGDNGLTWIRPLKLTETGTSSHRFPCMIDRAIPGEPECDTVAVLYMDDQVAGFSLYGQGPGTYNPVVVRKIPVDEFPWLSVDGPRPMTLQRAELAVNPSVVTRSARISYAVPQAGDVSLAVHDVSGRLVRTLVSGRQPAGRYSLSWDASDAAPGIYFCTLTAASAATTRKLVRSR